MITIESAGLTDVGQKREHNEDAFFIDDSRQLYVVADGMGGHLAGEVASAMVVDTFRSAETNGGSRIDPCSGDESLSAEANRVLTWIRSANAAVYKKSTEDENCRGMGSTVVAIYCTDTTLIAANVGDSPIYLVRDGEIELLSVPHTVAAEQAGGNPERLQVLPERFLHMLSRAIGVKPDVVPDVCETPCFEGDTVILCSDGLSNMVSPEEMIDIVKKHPPGEACRCFVELANERGGDDNITVIVLRVDKVGSNKQPLLYRFIEAVCGFFKKQ